MHIHILRNYAVNVHIILRTTNYNPQICGLYRCNSPHNSSGGILLKLIDLLGPIRTNKEKIYQTDDKTYWLQVQRKEIHNGQSLYSLNKELYKLAGRHYLQSYDGYDVGNADPSKPIVTNTYIVPEEFSANDFLKDGYPFILVVNNALDKFTHKEEFCYFIKVTCDYPIVDESKLPNDAELETFDKLEQAIEGLLKAQNIKNYYVFRSTHMGERNFFIVTNNKETANKTMKNFQKTSKIFPFKYEIIKDGKWTIYGLAKKSKAQP